MALTSAGLVIKTFEEVDAEIKADMRASPILNPNGKLPLDSNTDAGQVIAVVADKIAEAWQVIQAVYASQYRQSAEGASLDALVDLIGLQRQPPAAGRVTLTGTGVNGTILPAGRSVRDPARPAVEWITLSSVTISGGVYSVEAQASVTGPIPANAGTLTQIVTPVAGWTTVTNPADAAVGKDIETDRALRQRMLDLFAGSGARSTASIRSAVLRVAGVVEAYVFENPSDSENDDGVPGHNIEVVVDGGDDLEIAQAIYDNKSEGIGTFSAQSGGGIAVDVRGESVVIAFSRPIDVPIFVYVQIESNGMNSNVVADVKARLATYGNSLPIGAKQRRTRFIPEAFAVNGVLGVLRLGISTIGAVEAKAASLTLEDIALYFRENGLYSSINIEVEVASNGA